VARLARAKLEESKAKTQIDFSNRIWAITMMGKTKFLGNSIFLLNLTELTILDQSSKLTRRL